MKKKEALLAAFAVFITLAYFYNNFLLDEKYAAVAKSLFAKLFGA